MKLARPIKAQFTHTSYHGNQHKDTLSREVPLKKLTEGEHPWRHCVGVVVQEVKRAQVIRKQGEG